MKVNKKNYIKRKGIKKALILTLLILISIISFVSCGKLDNEETFDSNVLQSSKEKNKQNMVYEDYGAYDYWNEFIKNEKNIRELNFVIKWLKKNKNCIALKVEDSSIIILPTQKEKKIKSKNGFDRVKKFLLNSQLLIINNWWSTDNIIFLCRVEDLNGNYRLEYTEKDLGGNKGDVVIKKNRGVYKKVTENLYSEFREFEDNNIYDKLSEEQLIDLAEECKVNSYDYWNTILENEENLEEMYYIVKWLKKSNYFTHLSVENNGIGTLPNKKKIVKRIKSEDEFERVNKFLIRTKIKLDNNWLSRKNINFLFEFDLKGLSGHYCLVYTEDKIRDRTRKEILDEDKIYYQKVIENFYSYVIFYE